MLPIEPLPWSGVGSSGSTKKPEPVSTDPHTVSFIEAADDVGVTVWVLREWRRKNYFPEPHRRDGRLWFTPSQVQLLRRSWAVLRPAWTHE